MSEGPQIFVYRKNSSQSQINWNDYAAVSLLSSPSTSASEAFPISLKKAKFNID